MSKVPSSSTSSSSSLMTSSVSSSSAQSVELKENDRSLQLKLQDELSLNQGSTVAQLESKREREEIISSDEKFLNSVRDIVFAGGSIKGIAHVGAMQEIIKLCPGFLNQIQNIAGSSAGAIMAFFIGLGYSIDEIKSELMNLDFPRDFFGDNPRIAALLKELKPGVSQEIESKTIKKLAMALFPEFKKEFNFLEALNTSIFKVPLSLYSLFPYTFNTILGSLFLEIILIMTQYSGIPPPIMPPNISITTTQHQFTVKVAGMKIFWTEFGGGAQTFDVPIPQQDCKCQLENLNSTATWNIFGRFLYLFRYPIILYCLYKDVMGIAERFKKSVMVKRVEPPSLSNGNRLKEWLCLRGKLQLLASEIGKKPEEVTFSDLKEYRGKDFKGLYITGLDIETGCTRIFSHETTPDMSVVMAVRISASLPFAFRPVGHGVDGGVLDNYPMKFLNLNHALGFMLVTDDEMEIINDNSRQKTLNTKPVEMSFLDYLKKLGFAFYNKQSSDHLQSREEQLRTVYINVGHYKIEHFGIDETDKLTLIEKGREAVGEFINRRQTLDLVPIIPINENKNEFKSNQKSDLEEEKISSEYSEVKIRKRIPLSLTNIDDKRREPIDHNMHDQRRERRRKVCNPCRFLFRANEKQEQVGDRLRCTIM